MPARPVPSARPLELILLRKTIVVIADDYVDPHAIDPERMLRKSLEALSTLSGGRLAVQGDGPELHLQLNDDPWPLAHVATIWEVPLEIHDATAFINSRVGAGDVLASPLAELALISGLLSALPGLQGLITIGPGAAGATARDVPVVSSPPDLRMLAKNIGYVSMGGFPTKEKVLELFSALDPDQLRGLILDLRGERGAVLDAMVMAANALVDDGPLMVVAAPRRGRRTTWSASGKHPFARVPLVVLVDSQTSSGPEMLAAVLKGRGRAVVIGTSTANQPWVQAMYALRGKDSGAGSLLVLTVARCIEAGGQPFPASGVLPDLTGVAGLRVAADPLRDVGADRHLALADELLVAFCAEVPGRYGFFPSPSSSNFSTSSRVK